ncbi:hypothetical protein TYRP_020105 [Tyrophagus putrescentiae]|nr:hypothetical protein TYRP_020105 [Tyrophagus putrescentiae]
MFSPAVDAHSLIDSSGSGGGGGHLKMTGQHGHTAASTSLPAASAELKAAVSFSSTELGRV